MKKEEFDTVSTLENPGDYLDVKLNTLAEIIYDDLYELNLKKIQSGEHDLSKQVTLIEMKDLESSSCLLEAMDRILEISETDFKQLISESWSAYGGIFFLFHDGKEHYLSEREFFNTVVTLPGGADKVDRLIRTFIKYEGFDETYRNEEELALVFAVEALGLYDAKYLDTVLVFLLGVDWEHDVYNEGTLIPTLISYWNMTEAGIYFRIGVNLVCDSYIGSKVFKDILDKELADWIKQDENQKILLRLLEKVYRDVRSLGEECRLEPHLYHWMNEDLEDIAETIERVLDDEKYEGFLESLNELVNELMDIEIPEED